jgi:hypothetical protein
MIFYSSRLGDQSTAQRSGDDLRRAHPDLTVSLLADAALVNRPECLAFLTRVGVPV